MCQPESKSFAAVFITRMRRFVSSASTVCEVTAEIPTAASAAAISAAQIRIMTFFEDRMRMTVLLSRDHPVAIPTGSTVGGGGAGAYRAWQAVSPRRRHAVWEGWQPYASRAIADKFLISETRRCDDGRGPARLRQPPRAPGRSRVQCAPPIDAGRRARRAEPPSR